jgi:hypothetical protein
MQSTYEITDQGTDREALVFDGLRYWLDLIGDPQNSIGWVVEDPYGVQAPLQVGEAATVPGAREYVIERTREAIEKAQARAAENGWPTAPVEALRAELKEVARA